jgi:hypothetical protein
MAPRILPGMSGEPKHTPAPEPRIIREGGYKPTADPGPVPTSLVRPAQKPAQQSPAQAQDKKD